MIARSEHDIFILCLHFPITVFYNNTNIGVLTFYEIDQYSFSPGPHTLNIAYNLTTGRAGVSSFNFTGLVRERKLTCSARR